MTAPYVPAEGDLVDVVIRGAVVYDLPDPEDEPGEGYTTVAIFDGERRELVSVNLSYSQVTVTLAEPEPCATCQKAPVHSTRCVFNNRLPGRPCICGGDARLAALHAQHTQTGGAR